ncbi:MULTISPECIES: transporter substrate-binding domain-containing protein [Bacillus]|uniref:Amino acid ABC transporter substrate-binding protein, PAAT family n=1 Tax=Bacillus altitudinis TaxID=293387 RepID=A0A653XG72_BACAB|nr:MULTISPECIES: transporter substrate-binding domain-containing protein [Bacillus]MBX7000848.1 transporter substrate-binding domain-containing protein [Bacillus aerophilus]MDH8709266.1 L-cystine transport system substrate-binding protein [Micromonospora sp. 1209]KRV44604.1 L-cystine-binding protein TcyK [Bacillus sp. TH007]MBX7015877.1 transporter substrate-binding domain-containing protein [Bacillus aerophilus]MCM3061673.1 transporter substrate-binding domain-containing protein [Bacillus alt
MKNNRIFSNNYIIGLLLLGSLLLAACGNNEQSDEVKAEANNNDPDAKEIVIGTGNAYQPFVYLDENGKLTGYEKAVLDEVDQLLPQYKFKYESFEFKNILPALDAGKVDLAAHQYEINDERQKKYLFGKVGYTDYTSYVVVNKASGHDFQSLDDLAGHKVHTSTGSNFAYLLEQYNAKHDRKIDIVYGDGGNEILVKNLQNGTVDAALLTKYDVNKLNKQFNANLVTSGKPVNVSKTYYLYQKNNTKLQKDIDQALQKLIDNGKLAELSKKILGGDFTTS